MEALGSAAELAAYEPCWRGLLDAAPCATPFQSPEWLLPWVRHLFLGGHIRALAGEDAFAPMFLYGGSPPRSLALLGAGVTDYLDMLGDPAPVFEALAARRACFDTASLDELRACSPLLKAAPPSWTRQPASVCPVLELPAAMNELEARLTKKFRHNLRNSRNRLLKAGASFETAASAEFRGALFRLHGERWRQREQPGVLDSARLRAFHTEVMQGFAERGWLRLHAIRLAGELRAVLYVFHFRRSAYFYLSGFDPALGAFSPGTALLGYAISEAIREGLREFDFLRATEDYKYRWGAADRQNTRLLL